MIKKAILCSLLLASLPSMANASPWACFNGWISRSQALLKDVTVYHQNAGLIESYAFDSKSSNLGYSKSPGREITDEARHCGCTVNPGIIANGTHLEGLCGHI